VFRPARSGLTVSAIARMVAEVGVDGMVDRYRGRDLCFAWRGVA
jgi:hypothetical protein